MYALRAAEVACGTSLAFFDYFTPGPYRSMYVHSSVDIPPSLFVFRSIRLATARFTHDIIALVAFGVDVGSITATPERPCHSFDAIEVTTTAVGRLIRGRFAK